jgi:hypothetical protein
MDRDQSFVNVGNPSLLGQKRHTIEKSQSTLLNRFARQSVSPDGIDGATPMAGFL